MILPTSEFVTFFKSVPGALSVTESIAIMNIAANAPAGIYLELGTHKGKSAISARLYMKAGAFNLVDPIFEDKELAAKVSYIVANANEQMVFCPTLAETSLEAIPKFNDLSYVFIDSGSHGDGLPMQEVMLLEDRMIKGGIIAFHDFRSQFTEVEQAYNYLLSTGKYEEISINWNEIIDYVRENDLEKGNDTWHHTEMEFPCFVGAVRKIN